MFLGAGYKSIKKKKQVAQHQGNLSSDTCGHVVLKSVLQK